MTESSLPLGSVVDIDIGAVDATDVIKQCFKKINACAQRLQKLKVTEIDPRGNTLMPKVVWKQTGLRQSVIYRAIELHNATATLINANNLLGALILVRTIVELMAFVEDVRAKIASGVEKNDLGQIDGAIQSTNFATRWDNMPEEAKATNILTLLARFDKDFMGQELKKSVAGMHAILSEFTHPNWVGMAGFFGQIDHETRIQHFSVVHRDRSGLFTNIAGGCVCLTIIELLVRELLNQVAPVWTISEAERLAGK